MLMRVSRRLKSFCRASSARCVLRHAMMIVRSHAGSIAGSSLVGSADVKKGCASEGRRWDSWTSKRWHVPNPTPLRVGRHVPVEVDAGKNQYAPIRARHQNNQAFPFLVRHIANQQSRLVSPRAPQSLGSRVCASGCLRGVGKLQCDGQHEGAVCVTRVSRRRGDRFMRALNT